jgi:hypothetical protein
MPATTETQFYPSWRSVASSQASQLVEFAVALPLLVVLVVGIFDFGTALNLKHQLSNVADDAARFGASLPMSDLEGSTSPPPPGTVYAIASLINSYMETALINDCSLNVPATTGAPFSWTTQGSGCGSSTLSITIDRAYMFQSCSKTSCMDVLCTRVVISYPYQWHFGSVVQLLVPGATYGSTIQIAAQAIMPNMR